MGQGMWTRESAPETPITQTDTAAAPSSVPMYYGPHFLSVATNAPLPDDFVTAEVAAQTIQGLPVMWEPRSPTDFVAGNNFTPLKCLVNIRRASLRLMQATGNDAIVVHKDANAIDTHGPFKLEFKFDSSMACKIRVYWLATDIAGASASSDISIRLRHPSLSPTVTDFHFSKGLNRTFTLPPSHYFNPHMFSLEELTMGDLIATPLNANEVPSTQSVSNIAQPIETSSEAIVVQDSTHQNVDVDVENQQEHSFPRTDKKVKTDIPTPRLPNDDTIWYPLIIVAETVYPLHEKPPPTAISIQHTYASLMPASDGSYNVKVLKQNILDIYGFAETDGPDMTDSGGNAENSPDCIVCMADTKDTIVLPCRHLCLCRECADQLRQRSQKCPICRQDFHSLLHIKLPDSGLKTLNKAQSVAKLEAVSEKSVRSRASSAILRTADINASSPARVSEGGSNPTIDNEYRLERIETSHDTNVVNPPTRLAPNLQYNGKND